MKIDTRAHNSNYWTGQKATTPSHFNQGILLLECMTFQLNSTATTIGCDMNFDHLHRHFGQQIHCLRTRVYSNPTIFVLFWWSVGWKWRHENHIDDKLTHTHNASVFDTIFVPLLFNRQCRRWHVPLCMNDSIRTQVWAQFRFDSMILSSHAPHRLCFLVFYMIMEWFLLSILLVCPSTTIV